MSKATVELAALLLKEFFGSIVEEVGRVLMRLGSIPLRFIAINAKQTIGNVKKALLVLLQHHLAGAALSSRGPFMEYTIDMDAVLLLVRYPQYIYVAKVLYQDFGEHVIEELLKQGQMTMSSTIERIVNRLLQALSTEEQRNNGNLSREVHEVFVKLIETRFVERSFDVSRENFDEMASSKASLDPDKAEEAEAAKYLVPQIKLHLIVKQEIKEEEDEARSSKRRKLDESVEKQPDEGIFWKVNFSRFHQFLRDQLIVEAVRTRYDDEKAGELVQVMLRLSETKTHTWAEVSTPVSKQDIASSALKETSCSSIGEIEAFLNVFNDDMSCRLVSKTEERAGGGMYSVNLMKTMEHLVESCLASIVENKFGARCCRIFRLLLSKKYLQQKQLEEIVMIPNKDAKEWTYTLIKEGFVKTMQFPKQPDYAPSRTLFMFTVDLDDLCRNIVEKCKKSLQKSMIRRECEQSQNRVLLERKNFIDAVIADLSRQGDVRDVLQQIDDLNQSFSSHDKDILDKTSASSRKLELSELQVDETLFLLQIWLSMKKTQK